jgi:hypothetical protein
VAQADWDYGRIKLGVVDGQFNNAEGIAIDHLVDFVCRNDRTQKYEWIYYDLVLAAPVK